MSLKPRFVANPDPGMPLDTPNDAALSWMFATVSGESSPRSCLKIAFETSSFVPLKFG
jgi:hypothetical protein